VLGMWYCVVVVTGRFSRRPAAVAAAGFISNTDVCA